MRTISSMVLILLFSASLFSQENNSNPVQVDKSEVIEHKKYVYCQIMGRERLLSSKFLVDIDFGQPVSFWTPDRSYRDENGKPVSFNSMVDAMNFMGSLGWEFVQAYVVTENKVNIFHWLLKMEINDKHDVEAF